MLKLQKTSVHTQHEEVLQKDPTGCVVAHVVVRCRSIQKKAFAKGERERELVALGQVVHIGPHLADALSN